MKKIISLIAGHKAVFLVILAVLLISGYFFYKHNSQQEQVTQYSTARVTRGMLISSVSGVGQVAASSQVELKPEASGSVISVNVQKGQAVKKGALIAQLNAGDALKSVRDAEISLESARLSMEKTLQPADKLSVMQSENALTQTKEDQLQAETDLEKAYEDGFNEVGDTFLDLPSLISDLDTILYSYEIYNSEVSVQRAWNKAVLLNSVVYDSTLNERGEMEQYINKAETNYQAARDAYNQNFIEYQAASRYSDKDVINDLIEQTLQTVRLTADAVKSFNHMFDFWIDYRSQKNLSVFNQVNEYVADLNSYTGQVNGHISSLLNIADSINSAEDKIVSLAREIEEKQESHTQLLAGADALDVQSQQISVKQKENALLDAREKLADYSIRAPIDGTIAELDLFKGDNVSSGSSVGSIISDQMMAEITLNEIDAAAVAVGQKATLQFDAVPDLSLSGEVVDVDTLGAVSSGVVSYNVKIAFDLQDDRIKSGMSVSVSVIVEARPDVLMVPASAVKIQGTASYVEVLAEGAPQSKPVTTGLSNDTMIEITDGLAEGDEIITQTITTSTAGASSDNGAGGQNDSFGGMMRIMR
jgi:RND family efflux transporter MFP subunit